MQRDVVTPGMNASDMKVIFGSKDFASIAGAGLGFNNRRPGAAAWHYQGRVQHRQWQGTYECLWDGPQLLWTVHGDERLFALAAALKARGLQVEVKQDNEA
jgi:hypothetical protein